MPEIANINSIVLAADRLKTGVNLAIAELEITTDPAGSLDIHYGVTHDKKCTCAINDAVQEVKKTTIFSSYDRLFKFTRMFETGLLHPLLRDFEKTTVTCAKCDKEVNNLASF